jgi:hypothetical protein
MVLEASVPELNGSKEDLRTISHLDRKAVTFKGGRDRLAHKWYRLTPSYSPELVTRIIEEFGNEHTRVLDPFSGRGTTAIECQIQNIPCLGIEINPMLQFAGKVSLNWNIKSKDFTKTAEKLFAEFLNFKKENIGKSSLEVSEIYEVGFPQIHNVHRWWREDVLCDLLVLKGIITNFEMSDQMRDLFFLNLSNIIVDVANITLGRLQLHFIDRDGHEINSLSAFKESCQSVANDLLELNELGVENKSKIILGDSTQMANLVEGYDPNLIITSPPYPNRYSYVWNTRPHLYFMDFFTTPREAGNLDADTIGGTWGTATSRHMKGEFQYTDEVSAKVISPIVDEIREKDLLMSNYVAMYFDDMYRHILQLNQCIKSGAICAYVVGNSRIKKSIVETDVILGDLFKSCGYRLIRFEEIRRRNSGKELHETVVFTEKI